MHVNDNMLECLNIVATILNTPISTFLMNKVLTYQCKPMNIYWWLHRINAKQKCEMFDLFCTILAI